LIFSDKNSGERQGFLFSSDSPIYWKLLEFPHEIPDSIEISRDDFITAFEKNRVYMLSTDGKKINT